jgi:hypothetical protein
MRDPKPRRIGAPIPQTGDAAALAPDDAYELVRLTFHARLPAECSHLARLASQLTTCGDTPAPVFAAIEKLGHQLRGAAAEFDQPGLSLAAKTLELAAIAALAVRATNMDLAVASAIQALSLRLTAASVSLVP